MEARKHFDAGYQLTRDLEDDYLLSFMLEQDAHAASHHGDFERARALAMEQVRIEELLVGDQPEPEPGSLDGYFNALLNLGSAVLDLAKQQSKPLQEKSLKEALATHLRAKEVADKIGDELNQAHVAAALGEDYHLLEEREKAWDYLQQAIHLLNKQGMLVKKAFYTHFLEINGYRSVKI